MAEKQKKSFLRIVRKPAVLGVIFSILFAGSVRAVEERSPVQELAQRLPDNVLGFVATSGGDSLESSFDASIPGRFWHEPSVQSFYQQIKGAIQANYVWPKDPNDAAIFNNIFNLTKLALKRPMVIGVAEQTSDNKVPIYGFLFLDAGERKSQISDAVGKIEALADKGEITLVHIGPYSLHGIEPDNDLGLYWGWVDNYFVVTANNPVTFADKADEFIKYLSGKVKREKPLNHLTTMNKLQGYGDALVMYVDCQKTANVIQVIMKHEHTEKELAQITAVFRELGLSEVGSLTGRFGFAGSDLAQDSLLEVPEPFSGLLAQFKTVDLAQLDMVDAQAVSAGVINCDISAIYDVIISAIKAAIPENEYNEMQGEMANFETKAGFKIRQGLLAGLAGPTVYYSLPAGVMMEAPSGGMVVIADLKNASLLEESLLALGNFAGTISDGMLQVSSQENNGRIIHSWMIAPLAMMQIMPCWTVVDNRLIVTSNLPLCNIAMTRISSKEAGQNSIRTTEEFKKATTNLPQNLISFSYVDSKVSFTQMMMAAQQFWPMATMLAGKKGIHLPAMLPSVANVTKDMGPMVDYSWIDPDGIRFRTQGPMVTEGVAAVGCAAIAVSVAMPALGRSREVAKQVVCASQLKGIGLAIMMYQNDHQEKYPAKLEDLIETVDVSPKSLVCPSSDDEVGQTSYIYRGADLDSSASLNMILVHDRYENHHGKCRNVLFADGHVEKMSEVDFRKAIEKDNEIRRKMELPEKPLEEITRTRIPQPSWPFSGIMRGRIDTAKWTEGKAMAGTIATCLRAYGAELGSGGNYGNNRPTLGEMGFQEDDLMGTYFTSGNYSWVTSYDTDRNAITFTITITKPDEIFSPSCWKLNNDGKWTSNP